MSLLLPCVRCVRPLLCRISGVEPAGDGQHLWVFGTDGSLSCFAPNDLNNAVWTLAPGWMPVPLPTPYAPHSTRSLG
jgi:hypothetical protein